MPGFGPHAPHNQVGKEKFDATSFKKILAYCKPYLPAIIFSIFCAIIGAVATIIGPDKISEMVTIITNGVINGVDMHAFIKIAVFLVVLYAVGAIFNYLQQYIMAIVTQKTSKKLRTDITQKINKLPLAYFDNTTKGDILSRVTNDVDTISQTLGSSIANIISSIVLFVGVVFMMFKTNWILALVTIGCSVLGFVFMALIIKKSQKYFNLRQQYIGDLNGHIEEIYSNLDVVKSYNAKDNEFEKFKQNNTNIYNTTWKAQFMSSAMMPIMSFVGNLSYVMIFVVGVSIILGGGQSVTLGTLMSFIIYAKLFSQPLSTFAQNMNSIQQASASGKRVFDLLEQPEILDESNKKSSIAPQMVHGDVEFRNVRFAYDPNKIIINNFSAQLKAGQKVAIVGPTGAGKTTMVNLLMRFYELNDPLLILDGKITNYKVFDNGKSIKLLVKDDSTLEINGVQTEYKIDLNLPKNVVLKFNQNFELLADETPIDTKVELVVGNDIAKIDGVNFAVAYYGDIFIDNVPIKSLTRQNIHDLFDMILQDTCLFKGTIKENLVFNTPNVSREKLNQVCSAVGLSHFISTLPNGYDTMLDDVASLSEGQKQQLTIARAMIKDSPLLILDEATSNVDTRTELIIQQAMDKMTQGRTSFVIAHRLSTIKNADVILVMKNGDIIEHGTHQELLKQNGFYAELYNSQFVNVG